MNETSPSNGPVQPAAEPGPPPISKWIRRVHMFAGLFLVPWMLMYALSTLVMTHRDWVASFYPTKNPKLVTDRELDYSRTFPTNTAREQIGRQILQDLGMDGTHTVSGGRNGRPLVINRAHPVRPQRITLDAVKGKVTLQHEEFRAMNFLERMHRRRGYNAYSIENTWGFTVDVAVVTMMFWSLSGLWMWWELRATRAWGTAAVLAGMLLFGLLVALL